MKLRILLVDDDEDLRMMLCEALQLRGLDVESVSSAEAGLARLDASPFELVVTDLEMPGMSGLEMCAALRDRVRPPASIILTASKSAEIEAAALGYGAFACVAKPFRVDDLEATIRQALEHGFSRDEARTTT